MDPFADEADNEAGHEPAQAATARFRRPWWRWNYFTLAGTLFVALWIRELGGLPLAATGLLVATIFVAWAVAPVALDGTPLLAMRPSRSSAVRSGRKTRRPAGTVCRVAALLIGAIGVIQACTSAYWMLSQMGGYQRAYAQMGPFSSISMFWAVFVSAAHTSVMSIALAIGLWTIGGVAARVEELAEAEADRSTER